MSGRSWKFESSHGHEKQKSANSRFFFALPSPFSCFCFPHTTTGCPSLSSKKHDNIDNKDNISFLFQKVLSKVVHRCRQKKHDNIDNKDNISFLFQKVLSKVVPRCRQKNTTTKTTFLSYSKSVVQGCPSLSSK